MIVPSRPAVRVHRVRDHGSFPPNNVFVICAGPRDIIMWVAPIQRVGDFCRRILCQDTLQRTVLATGTLDLHRLDFVQLLYMRPQAIPQLVRDIFTCVDAADEDRRLLDFAAAELWIESKPTNLTIADIIGHRPTLH